MWWVTCGGVHVVSRTEEVVSCKREYLNMLFGAELSYVTSFLFIFLPHSIFCNIYYVHVSIAINQMLLVTLYEIDAQELQTLINC